jgi:hypothetical protein
VAADRAGGLRAGDAVVFSEKTVNVNMTVNDRVE